jgi:mono/diheme cytochrome c family protein/glucose/arabinose dehydrogenase
MTLMTNTVRILQLIFLLLLSISLYFCKTVRSDQAAKSAATGEGGDGYKRPDIPWMKAFSTSPVLTPEQALRQFTIEDGFEISLVASEPIVQTPVNILFDERGRLWVTEMTGYMPDVYGNGENVPNGKIIILEDTDQDGVMDQRTVFLDSLVLPRSICFIENGLLVAEPPRLWFYEITNDRPGKRTLVDSVYAVGGNVEHQPNGLLRAADNWIYNAKSAKRYRKSGDRWLIEATHFRGQWGLTQDNQGRLYYNHNSANVHGDNFLPGVGHWNRNQKGVTGFNAKIVANNRVYPLRPTPGVNRGYMKGILDDSLRLTNFTAACGPLIYRGDLFPPAYHSNAFVPEPSANLIKRNIIEEDGYLTPGRQAYANREFLASTDERFRPVTLTNAPDGAMYVLDMYRGIIQHKTYVTPYLRQEINERALTQPLTMGRIYKIKPKGAAPNSLPVLSRLEDDLIAMLGHPNGWIRDYAQQKLVDQRSNSAPAKLRLVATRTTSELELTHTLWTLEGLGALTEQDILPLYERSSFQMKTLAFGLTPSVLDESNHRKFVAIWEKQIKEHQAICYPYIAFSMHALAKADRAKAWSLLQKLATLQPDNPYLTTAIISTLHDQEAQFLMTLDKTKADTASTIVKQLKVAIDNGLKERNEKNKELLAKTYPLGAEFYQTICQTCHGEDGNGVQGLAPPLNQSEWVTGQKDILAAIVLYGLSGPVMVNNRMYQAPEINSDMPGIGYDPTISNEQIAEMLSFIRKSWQNNADPVTSGEVEKVREKFSGREKPFTIQELEQ